MQPEQEYLAEDTRYPKKARYQIPREGRVQVKPANAQISMKKRTRW
jgi:hypothetical protein